MCLIVLSLPTAVCLELRLILLLKLLDDTRAAINTHQQKTFPSGQNGSVRVDALRQSRQRHPGGGLLCTRRQYHTSHCTSPSDRSFAVSSSDSARAFSDAPERTCSSGGAFRTLRDLTIRIVKFWSSSAGDLVPDSQSSGS